MFSSYFSTFSYPTVFSFSLALLFSPLGFLSLLVLSCSFCCFPFACFSVLEPYGLVFLFFLYLCCFYVLTVCHSVFLSLSFSLPVSPSTSLPLQLVFIRRLYSCAVRLSSADGSLSLVSLCSPSSAYCLCDLHLSSAPVSLRFLSTS